MQNPLPRKWNPTSSPTFWINHASRGIMRRFEERLRPLGFGVAYMPVAVTLMEHGPMQQKDLLAHVTIEQPTMTALLNRMERDGLIKRKPDPSDARARVVHLTPKAHDLQDAVRAEMGRVVANALKGISAKDLATLTGTLKTIVRNLEPSDA